MSSSRQQRVKRINEWPWQQSGESSAIFAKDIIRDPALQVRTKPVSGLANKYAVEMSSGHQFPPIRVAKVNGQMFVIDGFHRLEAAQIINGQEAVEAVVIEMSRSEAIGAASDANATNGQGLSAKDKRKKLAMHIKAGRHKRGGEIVQSYGDLVKILGIGKTTLHRWMQIDHPDTFKKMQKDKKQRREDAEPPEIDHDPEHLRAAQQALRDALHHCDALRDPEMRWDVIEEAVAMVAKMKLKPHEVPLAHIQSPPATDPADF